MSDKSKRTTRSGARKMRNPVLTVPEKVAAHTYRKIPTKILDEVIATEMADGVGYDDPIWESDPVVSAGVGAAVLEEDVVSSVSFDEAVEMINKIAVEKCGVKFYYEDGEMKYISTKPVEYEEPEEPPQEKPRVEVQLTGLMREFLQGGLKCRDRMRCRDVILTVKTLNLTGDQVESLKKDNPGDFEDFMKSLVGLGVVNRKGRFKLL